MIDLIDCPGVERLAELKRRLLYVKEEASRPFKPGEIDVVINNFTGVESVRFLEGDEIARKLYNDLLPLIKGLQFEVALLLHSKITCAAENCKNRFIPTGRNAWRMKYCSKRCRLREAQKRYRRKCHDIEKVC